MRSLLVCIFIFFVSPAIFAQQTISGKVISRETGSPIPFANVEISKSHTLTNIKGEFQLENSQTQTRLSISYPGHQSIQVDIVPQVNYYLIELPALSLRGKRNFRKDDPANDIIKKAIAGKEFNDPGRALASYTHKSYNKLVVDKQKPTNLKGREFLSEKVSQHLYLAPTSKKELISGINTPGFEDPVYEVLTLNIEPHSLYGENYPIYGTNYAGPLGTKAFKNYHYKILDTVITKGRPGYMIYFKPKRPKAVAGWEGVIFLDTVSFAIQRSKTQLGGPIEIEIDEDFEYFEEENIWFPVTQRVILKPGTGGENISVFGGSISLGTVQRTSSIFNLVLAPGQIEKDLALTSVSTNYEIALNDTVEIEKYSPSIKVLNEANDQSVNFWEINRRQPFTVEDELTAGRVENALLKGNILRKIEVLNAISQGFFPVGFVDLDLSKFVNYNNYEGFRMGAGGQTNEGFSRKFRLDGYLAYGNKDHAWKYGVGGGALLHQRSGTWWNVNYSRDIREIAGYDYLKGVNEFSILEPRFANITYHYAYKTIKSSLERRLTPRLDSELQFSYSDISQLRAYQFLNDGKIYREYIITEAKLGFLWRPFSKFISTPQFHSIYENKYPVITGQITQGLAGVLNGDFNFTKLGLKAEYEINRQDRSVTQVTLVGNYAVGDLPLTHAFHAFPNNPEKPEILDRFSVAGKISFETMYFNEFFSDRQAAVHIRHQLRPFRITDNINPEFALISRHVIGNFNNIEAHQNIEFSTLEHGFSEVGLELNQIFLGIGLSTAYRYGAYHLPTFKENFSFKFTFNLKI
ncbi:MAG: DUF5686 family protein [Gillisia sp.]